MVRKTREQVWRELDSIGDSDQYVDEELALLAD